MSSESAARLVDLRHRRPRARELAGLVRGLVAVRVVDELSLYTVPHGSLALSIQLGSELGSYEQGGLAWHASALTGLRKHAVAYAARPSTRTVVALLSPHGAFRLLSGTSCALFVERRASLAELLPRTWLRELGERLRGAWSRDPLSVLEHELGRLATLRRGSLPLSARRAFRALELVRSDSPPDIAALYARLDVSRRQLERDCAAWLGLTPKELFATRRLQSALACLQAGASLASSAAQAGFADQAHMAHVLKRATGRPPSAWARTPRTSLGTAYRQASGGELVTL